MIYRYKKLINKKVIFNDGIHSAQIIKDCFVFCEIGIKSKLADFLDNSTEAKLTLSINDADYIITKEQQP